MDGPIPALSTRSIHGRMDAAHALAELLRGTGLRAVPVGRGIYRLEPTRRRSQAPGEAAASVVNPEITPDIIVSARKRPESLSSVAAPLTVIVPGDEDEAPPARTGTSAIAATLPGLSATNPGPGSDRQFIRGIADSPFLGLSQSTVAVLIDDNRIVYDGPDPDLRLVDVDRVEILKGPQGPLYGTGALGGVYRVVTRKPILGGAEATADADLLTLDHGGIGGDADAVVNVPLANDRIAVRATGYVSETPGWITDRGLAPHANAEHVIGGRVAVRAAPVPGWTVDLTGIVQRVGVDDSQYVVRDADAYSRTLAFREPRASNFDMAAAEVEGPIGRVDLTASTSISRNVLDRTYDASAAAASFGVAAPARFVDHRRYGVFDQEIRLSGAASPAISWLAGVSYLSASTNETGTIAAGDSASKAVETVHRSAQEAAVFAEGDAALTDRISAGLGVRLFRNVTEDEVSQDREHASSQSVFVGVSPSISISWRPDRNHLVYARYASAIRPGGLSGAGDGTRYDADSVDNVDLGSRLTLGGGRVDIDASVFRALWREVQSDMLLPNGLVAARNAGNATILGTDLAMGWRPARGLMIHAAAILQRARLDRTPDNSVLPDRRLPVVPDVAGSLKVSHDLRLGRWQGGVDATMTYNGSSRLSFDPGLDRKVPGYATIGAGAWLGRGRIRVKLHVDNLTNARSNTFAFGNPFSVFAIDQYTPLRPRAITAGLAIRF